jgi:hypothetical protein
MVLFLMVLKIRLNMARIWLWLRLWLCPYSNGYTDEEKPGISMMQSRKNYKQRKK